MGYSYQDIESRLRSAEDKLDFILKTFTLTQKTIDDEGVEYAKHTNLAAIYRDLKTSGAEIVGL